MEHNWHFGEVVNPEWRGEVVCRRDDDAESGGGEADLDPEEPRLAVPVSGCQLEGVHPLNEEATSPLAAASEKYHFHIWPAVCSGHISDLISSVKSPSPSSELFNSWLSSSINNLTGGPQ